VENLTSTPGRQRSASGDMGSPTHGPAIHFSPNGIIYRDYLTYGTYVIEEISAPEGYLLDENPIQTFFIDQTDDNKQFTLTFVNKRKPSLEIIKADAGNSRKKLAGAVFRVSEQGGSKSWDITTGYDGDALLENLEIGTAYIVEEIQAPSAYWNEGYREIVVLSECRRHTLTVTDRQKPTLTLRKIDADTGEGLSGAVFRVSQDGGAAFRDVTTGKNGEILLQNMEPGWYVITEQTAPNGYIPTGEPTYTDSSL
jgi:uncharacterized surface anchored protein